MIIVNAFWEKRNLGVDAVTFQIEKGDTLYDIIPLIEENNKEYQTAVVDPTKPEILLELQNRGFKFIECSLSLSAAADNVKIPEKLKRFQSQMEYRPASSDEIDMVKEMVRNEGIFKTDKIALDPFFGVEKSGIRYSFWIDDLIKSGNTLFAITFKNEVIGFEIAKITDGTVDAYLGGMLPCKAGKMLGAAMYVPSTLYWKEHGAKVINASVSSNNPPILKIHRSFGLDIVDWKYVLIKHSKQSTRLASTETTSRLV